MANLVGNLVEEKLVAMEGNLEDEKVVEVIVVATKVALLVGLLEGVLEDEKVMGVVQTEAKVEKLEEVVEVGKMVAEVGIVER